MFDRPDRILARLKAPLSLAAAMLVAWWLLEALVYRSGFYAFIAEPQSNTGAVVNALMLVEREYRPGARNVLVFGDSRIGEGFSARLADAAAGDPSLHFVKAAVPGSTPRTWYYLLREVLARGYRFEAVLVGTLYAPRALGPTADWALDPAHQAPLLRLGDAASYPASFASAEMRERARHAVLLPALALRQDTLALLAAPHERWRKLRRYRPAFLQAVPNYGGREETMPALGFDAAGGVQDWSGASAAQRALVEGHLAELRAPEAEATVAANRAYRERWFGALAELSAAHGARLLVAPLPRGPYREVQPPPAATPDAVAGRNDVLVLPTDLLLELEQPQYFFDVLHVNRAGRERMSTALGESVARVLGPEPR